MRLLKYFLIGSFLFTAVFFVTHLLGYAIFSGAENGTYCVTNSFCLIAEEMGNLKYSLAIAALNGVFYSFLVFLAYYTWVFALMAVVRKPYLTWAVVGGGVFTGIALVNIFVKEPYLSDFQRPLMPYIATLDFISAALVITACTIKARNKKAELGIYTKLLTFWIFNIFFLNIITIANGVNAWKDVSSIILMIGFFDVLLLSSVFKKSR